MKFIAVLLAFIATVSAAEKPQAVVRHARFLAVGEMPPFRQEIRGDVRYELEPPEGSIPPREVTIGSAAVSLRLGQISAPLEVPAGGGPVVLRRQGEADSSAPWLQFVSPESDDFLVLLWRDPVKGTWKTPLSFVIPDGSLSAPAGSVRVVNVSPLDVGIVIGSEKLILESGKSFQRQVPAGPEQEFQIVISDATGNAKRLHSGSIIQNPGERSLVLVYRADGEAPRRPVKVSVQREPVPVGPGR